MVTKGKMSKAEAKKWFDAKVKEHGLKAA
jgi:polyhydroxyalkanoate synthesis regulator phasin